MKRIGILSDTHGYLDPAIFHYFRECDEIWHAGDIGSLVICEKLENFKPLRAVYGNIDGKIIRANYPFEQHFTCEGSTIWLTHITGRPNAYNPHILAGMRKYKPTILVGGHSHILCVKRDQWGTLYFNPGAAGKEGVHQVRTLLRFNLAHGKLTHMEAIELPSG
ncbi:MAG: metallophosphoesterase family protein [Bacteroidota bacterium]